MSKQINYVVAVVLRHPSDNSKFLVVKRPADGEMADAWGLPATTGRPGELPEEIARRVCLEKLHCAALPIRFLGSMHQKRNSYDITLMDIEMILAPGSLPDFAQAKTESTRYVAQKWTSDPGVLLKSAQKGSCCSSIMLSDAGILDREKWILSLEGSALVD